jgi:thioredoxin-like negative regulator of GroEL
VAAALALAVFAAHIIGQRLSARTTLAEGQEAFRRGDFGRAADRFRSALGIDPASTAVRLRLIAADQMQFVPDRESLANHQRRSIGFRSGAPGMAVSPRSIH